MVDFWGSGASVLTITGALFFWGAQVLEMEGFYAASCVILGLALLMMGVQL